MRLTAVLFLALLALPAAAQEVEPPNPHRCAVQTATVAHDPALLRVFVNRDGKVFVNEAPIAARDVEAAVRHHLSDAHGNTERARVQFEAEPGTAARYRQGVLTGIRAGYAAAAHPLPVALAEAGR